MNALAKKIKHYKVQLGISNAVIAERSGLPETTISRICSGKTKDPKGRTLKLLAEALECTVDDLMDLEDGIEPYYLDKKTGDLAQKLKDNSDLKILLDASKDLSAEDLQTLIGMVNMLKRN